MDAMQVLLTRRSIRRYTSQPVAPDLVTAVLRAGMHAPSAGNQQPWHFVVITDAKTREAIPTFHPYADMVPEASVAILVCGDLSLERYRGYWVQDCSAATQNILLAAHTLGLGAVWVALYPIEDRVVAMRTLLGLPDRVVPLALVPLGYPAQPIPPENRFTAARIHREHW
jgi:nitroreductase